MTACSRLRCHDPSPRATKIAAVIGSIGYTQGVAAVRSPAIKTRPKVKRRLSICVSKSTAIRSLRVNDVEGGLLTVSATG
jgi:hypothetical protein